MDRRTFLASSATALSPTTAWSELVQEKKVTWFQIACMTLPYSRFPLVRALKGIQDAGYKYVAWGTTHKEDGKDVPVLGKDAAPQAAKDLAKRCRDLGLE